MVDVTFRSGNRSVPLTVAPEDNLLDVALGAGFNVSYSCRRGDCEQCYAHLVDGTVLPMSARQPLYISEGFLLCNARAATKALIDIPHYPELSQIKPMRSPVKIDKIRRLSNNVLGVSFRFPPSASFAALPGQYVRLTNRAAATRSYSIAEFAADQRGFSIHVRRVEGGIFSDYLFDQAKSNDLLQLEGPLGHFFIRAAPAQKSIFLATGTGIAPIYAMLSSLATTGCRDLGKIAVYWGNRNKGDAYLAEELVALSKHMGFSLELIVSSQSQRRRHVQIAMLEDHVDLKDAFVYACGSSAMIHAARGACAQAGLAGNRFIADPFTAS